MRTVLLLDDEASLLTLLTRYLARQGYSVLQAAMGEEAIERFIGNGRHIDLLIADVSLPDVSGVQMALLLRQEIPHLGVILTSGYPLSAWRDRDADDLVRLGTEAVEVLLKPFPSRVLLSTIESLMPKCSTLRAAVS